MFEIGVLNGHTLVMLEQVLTMVYKPLLAYHQHKNSSVKDQKAQSQSSPSASMTRENTSVTNATEASSTESKSSHLLRDEFVINLQKFAHSVSRTIQQIEGEVRLEVPDIALPATPEEAQKDPVLLKQVEDICRDWYGLVDEALTTQINKRPVGDGPLAEIEFWRERNAALSALHEQLKLPSVKAFLDIFTVVDEDLFDTLKGDLNKYYTEAKDNVRFLGTLERHFKNITYGLTFQSVIDTIPSMMNALRMVSLFPI